MSAMKTRVSYTGINQYVGSTNDLSGCLNDASSFNMTLIETGILRPASLSTSIRTISDKTATAAAMKTNLEWLCGESTDDKQLLIWQYSGHGARYWHSRYNRHVECFCPTDFVNTLQDDPVDDEYVESVLNKVGPNTKAIIWPDCCHSAGVRTTARSAGDSTAEIPSGARYWSGPLPQNHEITQAIRFGGHQTLVIESDDYNIIYLGASQPDQVSLEISRPNNGVQEFRGVFTFEGEELLRRNPKITPRQFAAEIALAVQRAGVSPSTQVPCIYAPAKWLDVPIFHLNW